MTLYVPTKLLLLLLLLNRFSRVQLFAILWTTAHQAPLSMGFSRQKHWSGLPFPSPGYLPNLGIKPGFPALKADSLSSEPPGSLSEPLKPLISQMEVGPASQSSYPEKSIAHGVVFVFY